MTHYVIVITSITGDRVVGPFNTTAAAWDEWNTWLRPNLPKGSDARVMPALQPRLYGGDPINARIPRAKGKSHA